MQNEKRANEEYQDMLARREARARARFRCQTCGSFDGMDEWDWYAVTAAVGEPEVYGERVFYWYDTLPERLFTPCLECNKMGVIPEGYELMTAAEVWEWLAN